MFTYAYILTGIPEIFYLITDFEKFGFDVLWWSFLYFSCVGDCWASWTCGFIIFNIKPFLTKITYFSAPFFLLLFGDPNYLYVTMKCPTAHWCSFHFCRFFFICSILDGSYFYIFNSPIFFLDIVLSTINSFQYLKSCSFQPWKFGLGLFYILYVST